MARTFYITTPIYYPSDKLHIGHSYCSVMADTMARYKRLRGFDVMFLTGTDEHGQKIQRKAEALGVTPKAYVDKIVSGIKDLWKTMDVSYDRFLRTTDPHHEEAVQRIFQLLYDKGDIYKGAYSGWYCTPCESFWTETQLAGGKCPDCGRDVEKTTEEAYFFRLSKYQDALIRHLEEHPDFLQPVSRANEMIANFLRPGLDDLCVSRTTFDWGIRVPFDEKHVIYVWVDALSNYITAMGWPQNPADGFDRYWPADIQLVGKEIVRFHAIIWPAILMALGLPLPKKVLGHGWLLLQDGKMSNSRGNVVDPVVLCERYGVDAIRYFLLREVTFGQDGTFSNEALIGRINSDLANDLGNLVSRTIAMIDRYFAGRLPDARDAAPIDDELASLCTALPAKVEGYLDNMQFSLALAEIWKVVGRSNKYIDETAPWILARDEALRPRLAQVLFNLAESLRIVSILLQPFLPRTALRIRETLGIPEGDATTWDSAGRYGLYEAPDGVCKAPPLFPRLDPVAELAAMNAFLPAPLSTEPADAVTLAASVHAPTPQPSAAAVMAAPAALPPKSEPADSNDGLIVYDEFAKVHLIVGRIMACEKLAGSDKLLKSLVDIGTEQRTILSGIAEHYTPEEMIGKSVVLVANLKPRKIRGVFSHGMLLAAEDADGRVRVLTVDGAVPPGSPIH